MEVDCYQDHKYALLSLALFLASQVLSLCGLLLTIFYK